MVRIARRTSVHQMQSLALHAADLQEVLAQDWRSDAFAWVPGSSSAQSRVASGPALHAMPTA